MLAFRVIHYLQNTLTAESEYKRSECKKRVQHTQKHTRNARLEAWATLLQMTIIPARPRTIHGRSHDHRWGTRLVARLSWRRCSCPSLAGHLAANSLMDGYLERRGELMLDDGVLRRC